jgi:hypothetical protein
MKISLKNLGRKSKRQEDHSAFLCLDKKIPTVGVITCVCVCVRARARVSVCVRMCSGFVYL